MIQDLRISLIQTSLHWEDKAANLKMLQNKIAGISEKSAIIILPEMFSTGFSMNNELLAETMEGETIQWMKKTAASKSAILTGSLIVKEQDAGELYYYNRLIWMLPTGSMGIYDKRHLFAFGKEDRHYTPGEKRLIASVSGWKINLQVCYDLRFPVWQRQSTGAGTQIPEYDLLIFVANWPAVRSNAWKVLLQARAIENQCYVIGVNCTGTDGNGLEYAGESMIIGPLGEIIKIMGSEEEIFTYLLDRNKLDQTRLKFPFLRDADSFHIQP